MLKSTLQKINKIKKLSKEYIDTNIKIYDSYSPSWHLFQDELIKQHPELESVLYQHAYPLLNYYHEYRENRRNILKKERNAELFEIVERQEKSDLDYELSVPKELIEDLTKWCTAKNAFPAAIKNVLYDLAESYEDNENLITWNYKPERNCIEEEFVCFYTELLEKYKFEDAHSCSKLCKYLWGKMTGWYI